MVTTSEFKKQITERYTSWAEAWGLALAYAVTQSVEESEKLVADAVVALIARDPHEAQAALESFSPRDELLRKGPTKPIASAKLPPSVTAVRFAAVLWELASSRAFRGFGQDAFFRMPAVTRAIVVLKTKAQFSRHQIAGATGLKVSQVDDHLENARLLFSDGRSWLQNSPGVLVSSSNEASWTPECPQLSANAAGSQDLFAQYVGHDLDTDASRKLQGHLLVCNTCRGNFSHFKKQYQAWSGSIPMIDVDDSFRKHIAKVTRMAFKVSRASPPSPWPGMRRMLRDTQIHIMLAGAAVLLLIHHLMNS